MHIDGKWCHPLAVSVGGLPRCLHVDLRAAQRVDEGTLDVGPLEDAGERLQEGELAGPSQQRQVELAVIESGARQTFMPPP